MDEHPTHLDAVAGTTSLDLSTQSDSDSGWLFLLLLSSFLILLLLFFFLLLVILRGKCTAVA